MEEKEITEFQLNTLKEVTRLGVERATQALAQMIDKKINITVVDVKLIPFEQITEILGGSEEDIVGLYFKMLGDITGSNFLVFSRKSAYILADMLLGEEETDRNTLSDMEKSALKELGNILTNAYLNILAEMLDVKIFSSIPHFAQDMLGAVIDFILIEISRVSDYALVIETNFEISNVEIEGNFLIFPDEESINLMFKKWGIEV